MPLREQSRIKADTVAASASEPAVRPLSEMMRAAFPSTEYENWPGKVAALEAELAEAKQHLADGAHLHERNLEDGIAEYDKIRDERDAARAEVEQLKRAAKAHEADWQDAHAARLAEMEQLRGRLADEHKRRGAIDDAEATDRVRSMREAAAKVIEGGGWICGYECGHDKCVETRRLARAIRALPLDTGTATDTGGEAELADPHVFCAHPPSRNQACDVVERIQADAIKAAVDKERERCLAWWEWFWGDTIGRNARTETGIRSGEDAPGAVGK